MSSLFPFLPFCFFCLLWMLSYFQLSRDSWCREAAQQAQGFKPIINLSCRRHVIKEVHSALAAKLLMWKCSTQMEVVENFFLFALLNRWVYVNSCVLHPFSYLLMQLSSVAQPVPADLCLGEISNLYFTGKSHWDQSFLYKKRQTSQKCYK